MNGVLPHPVLAEVGVELVNSESKPHKLMLSLVISESHSHKGLLSLRMWEDMLQAHQHTQLCRMLELEAHSLSALFYMNAQQKTYLHIVPESTSYFSIWTHYGRPSTRVLCQVWFLLPSRWSSAQCFAI